MGSHSVVPSLHRQPCRRCEHNWRQVKTVGNRKSRNCFVQSQNAVRSNENSFDLSPIDHTTDKTRQDKTVLSCPCQRWQLGSTCHAAAAIFLLLPQPKLALNLVTPERCKDELTCWWLYPNTVYLPRTVYYLRNNQTVSWLVVDSTTMSPESGV